MRSFDSATTLIHKLTRPFVLGALAVALLVACQTEPEMCRDMRPGALTPWLTKTWGPYCEKLDRTIKDPRNMPLIQLTEFFAQHPKKRGELHVDFLRYDEIEACFQKPAQQLQLEDLKACITDNDEMSLHINASWEARADPWFKEYELRIKDIRRDLNAITLLFDKVTQKTTDHFERHAVMEPNLSKKFAQKLQDVHSDMEFVDALEKNYTTILRTAKPHEQLAQMIDANYSDLVKNMLLAHAKNKAMYLKFQQDSRFFKLASASVGVQCPKGLNKKKDMREASKVLAQELKKVTPHSKKLRITQPRTAVHDPDKGYVHEHIKGFVCGARSESNQFEDRTQLCAKYRFEITRKKTIGSRNWEDWTFVKFEEGKAEDGIDCTLLH